MYEDPDLYYEERKKSRENSSHHSIESQSVNESFALAVESDIAFKILGSVPSEVEIHLHQSGIKSLTYFNSVTFVANFIVNSWLGRESSLPDIDVFIDVIKEEHVLCTVPVIFSSFRTMRKFQIETMKSYNVLKEMIMICLTQSQFRHNVSVPMDLINLANTYYFSEILEGEEEEKEKRVYLMEGIKEHKIFEMLEFWEGFLLRGIDISRKTFDYDLSKRSGKDFLKEINDSFFNIAMMMKEIVTNQEKIFQLLGSYFQAYKLPKSGLEKLTSIIKGKITD